MIPTVTFLSNCSPVRPSHKVVCPDEGNSANFNNSVTSSTDAPSKTGVDTGIPGNKFTIKSSNSLSFKGLIFFS